MDTKSITVNVPEEFYQTLNHIQEDLRQSEGKKTALSDILLLLAKKNTAFEGSINAPAHEKPDKDLTKILLGKLKYLDELESRLFDKERVTDSERDNLFRLRVELLDMQERRLTALSPQDELQIKAFEQAFKIVKSNYTHLEKSDNYEHILDEISKLSERINVHHADEIQQIERVKNEQLDHLSKLNNSLEEFRNKLTLQNLLPWITVVIIPFVVRFLDKKEHKRMMNELKTEIINFAGTQNAKNQEKTEK